MVEICKPEIIYEGDDAILKSKIIFKDREATLWFKTKKEYGKYFCDDRGDAFVVALIYYAMRYGEDIQVNVPVSERLYYQLTNYLIEALNKSDQNFKKIKIFCFTTNKVIENTGAVGTGISRGIDSFTTLSIHLGESCPSNYRITHLTFFNVGAFHSGKSLCEGQDQETMNSKANERYTKGLKHSRDFASKYGYKLVEIDSNISDFMRFLFISTHTFRNCAAVLTMQKLFSVYYYSSTGYPLSYFNINPEGSNGRYDIFTLDLLSTSETKFYSSGATMTRIEKTIEIANFIPSYDYLMVCSNDENNCSVCDKCIRTLITLDITGNLTLYQNVFNIPAYLNNRMKYFGRILYKKSDDPFNQEIKNYIYNNQIPIPMATRLYSIFLLLSRVLAKLLPEKIRERIKRKFLIDYL